MVPGFSNPNLGITLKSKDKIDFGSQYGCWYGSQFRFSEAFLILDPDSDPNFLTKSHSQFVLDKFSYSGIFLFPSHFCYSYQGDMEKISPNQPLRFLIKLVSLTKN